MHILLTPSDTGINYKSVYPSLLSRIKGGESVVVALSFKPGFSYTVNDTINKTGNTFQSFSIEELGNNTYPMYNEGEWNCSYVANSFSLKPYPSSWYKTFYPSWGWAQSDPEHYLIRIKTSYDNDWLGISDKSSDISNGNCFPNPASNQVLISYHLKNQQQITINIYDITGQLVIQQREGIQLEGQHFAQININDLSAGIYFYSVNNSEMKKLVKN